VRRIGYILGVFVFVTGLIGGLLTYAEYRNETGIIIMIIGLLALLLILFLVRCPHCKSRPVLRLLAIWTLFLDYELFIADTILLKRCVKCEKNIFEDPSRQ